MQNADVTLFQLTLFQHFAVYEERITAFNKTMALSVLTNLNASDWLLHSHA